MMVFHSYVSLPKGILIISGNYYYLWILDVLLEEKMPLWIAIIIYYWKFRDSITHLLINDPWIIHNNELLFPQLDNW